ncbi:uncharacterized protein At5g01610-like [Andrographis paniculata]|uniref:uncharacterized protein At5g01610-like n=1 Tax=Andrographis paniculata TaxID=175694 RepID=UPI0021E7E48B|nr:uncharacterized protein At5g01610-like [Andrographis paniculata]
MEKLGMAKMGSIKSGGFWLSNKAKHELSNITQDLSTVSNIVEEKAKWIFNKLKGKPLKTLPELLQDNNIPRGIFPKNILAYEFDRAKSRLTVHLPYACEASFNDSSPLRYGSRVKCILLRGKMMSVEGMKMKANVLVWTNVTSIAVEGAKSEKLCFIAGVKKSRPKDTYTVPREGVRIDNF